MDFVNDVDFIFGRNWSNTRFVAKIADVIYAIVASGVDLNNVDVAGLVAVW